MRMLDLPPLWLLAFLVLAWVSPWHAPWGGVFFPGLVCLALAALLTVAALLEFARARTTVIPHQMPSALIQSGVFRWTRNPIYLADVLILAGFALIWGSVLGVLLVLLLAVVLERRFIRPEEGRLQSEFGEAFEAYAASTRRWI